MPREISEKLAQKAEFLCYSDKLRSVISFLYLKFMKETKLVNSDSLEGKKVIITEFPLFSLKG